MNDMPPRSGRSRLRVCLVKQKSTYDLYTKETRDLRELVASSNWRTGPLALWQAFDCEFRLVEDDAARECQLGKADWGPYVEGWKLFDDTLTFSKADEIDWSAYDIVVSIDVAVPTRVVRKFPQVMWCYYWIEGGPTSLKTFAAGSPQFSYNVFLTHRLAKLPLTVRSREVRRMLSERRAVLDVPYYLLSSKNLLDLYSDRQEAPRTGICLSASSQSFVDDAELSDLSRFGDVRRPSGTLAGLLDDLVGSKYFVVHPSAPAKCGNAVIEAVSAGCLALAPRRSLWGYPELTDSSLDYGSIGELLAILDRLEHDPGRFESHLAQQRARVDEWCFGLPVHNLAVLHKAFSESTGSLRSQKCGEKRDLYSARLLRLARSSARRLRMGLAWNRHS